MELDPDQTLVRYSGKLSSTACSSFTGRDSIRIVTLLTKCSIISWPEVQYFFHAFYLACELIIPTVQQLASCNSWL